MIKKYQCWCCEEEANPAFTKGFGTGNQVIICGSCIGILAVVESRLKEISRNGKLDEDLTANSPDVPKCERD